jgi:transcriptional regulator with XRE-family HTH domain
MDTAKVLREARRRAGLTQAELAERSGTSQATISAYESGAKHPSVETLSRLLAETGSRLVVEEGSPAVATRSSRDHARAARTLLDVLELAAQLPVRHEPRLRFPRLGGPSTA